MKYEGPERRTANGYTFKREVTLGNIISSLLVATSLLGAALHFGARLTALETKVDALWAQFLQVTQAPPRGVTR